MRWSVYEELVFGVRPTLDRMTANGVRVDTEAQRALAHTLEDEIDRLVAGAQACAPLAVRPRKRYKRLPTEAQIGRDQLLEEVRVPAMLKTCSRCQQRPITKTAHMKGECKHAQVVMTEGERSEWDLVLPFNPLSTDQLKAYALYHRHPTGRNVKTRMPTMNDNHLQKLQRRYGEKHPLYRLVTDVREVSKAKSTYVDGFAPDADGMIRGIFKDTPKTGRLAQANVALMQVPKRDEHRFAHEIRRTIVPRPGHVFVGADSSAMEGVLTGYFADDPELIALSRKSVHAYLACRALGWEFTPEHVKQVKAHHADLYARYKRTVFLCLPVDHEVLTYQGWKQIVAVRPDEAIATWDRKTQAITFEVPSQWTLQAYDGPLHTWHGTSLSVRMTPNHRVPYRTDGVGGFTAKEAQDVPKSASVPLLGVLDAGSDETPDIWVQLAVAIQADAHVTPHEVRWCLYKPRKIDRLRTFLTIAGVEWRENWPENFPGRCHISVPRGALAAAFEYLTPEKTWYLPALLRLRLETRQLFLSEILLWDGCVATNSYCSMQKENCEAVQTIAHITGKKALVRKQCNGAWDVSFSKTRKCAGIAELEVNTVEPYVGTVGCPTVTSGFFLVRYRDRISVTGNSLYGGTPRMMTMAAPEAFPTERIAKETQDFFLDQFPSLKRWWAHTREIAHKQCYLDNPWGWRNYFYNVFRHGPGGETILGEDKNEVVAFLPQSSGGMFGRQNLRRLGESWALPYMPANGFCHDSLLLDVPKDRTQEAIDLLVEILTRPIPELGNLRIGCEVEVGDTWGDLETVCRVEAS